MLKLCMFERSSLRCVSLTAHGDGLEGFTLIPLQALMSFMGFCDFIEPLRSHSHALMDPNSTASLFFFFLSAFVKYIVSRGQPAHESQGLSDELNFVCPRESPVADWEESYGMLHMLMTSACVCLRVQHQYNFMILCTEVSRRVWMTSDWKCLVVLWSFGLKSLLVASQCTSARAPKEEKPVVLFLLDACSQGLVQN